MGIAVLDSGVMKAHDAFFNASGATRVMRNVLMLNANVANWTTGVDSTASLQPGSAALASYENSIANDSAATHDGYGHGTHVAPATPPASPPTPTSTTSRCSTTAARAR